MLIKNKNGFTLVEMLVVIAIVSILVAVSLPAVMGSTLKSKAATNAANLRAVQGKVATLLITDENKVANPSSNSATNETLTYTDITLEAPAAEPMSVGNFNIPEGTNMRVTVDGNVVVAYYKGYTAEDFAIIAETGSADGITPSVVDNILADATTVLDSTTALGNKVNEYLENLSGADIDATISNILTSLGITEDAISNLESIVDNVIDQIDIPSDCPSCYSCSGYTDDGSGGNICTCGHAKALHISSVLQGTDSAINDLSATVDKVANYLKENGDCLTKAGCTGYKYKKTTYIFGIKTDYCVCGGSKSSHISTNAELIGKIFK